MQQRLFNDLAMVHAWCQSYTTLTHKKKNTAKQREKNVQRGSKCVFWKPQAQEPNVKKELIAELKTANVTMTSKI